MIVLPGFFLAVLLGVIAWLLSQYYNGPVMLFALLLGIAWSFLYDNTRFKSGIDMAAGSVLRLGVALLGLRVAFSDLTALGWQTALVLCLGIISTLLIGVGLAKAFGLQKRFGVLTGGAVGICGASAALAISSVLPASKAQERDTLLTIVCITALSTTAMLVYPILASFLNLTPTQTSIFLGGTIHDVAQVVGAGYSVSEQTGDLATLTKLVRVAFLMPVVLCIAWVIKRKFIHNTSTSVNNAPVGIPAFLSVFVILMVLNSVVDVPPSMGLLATDISRFALIIAMAAIGLKSNLRQLQSVGVKPILLVVLETLWLAGVILLALAYL
ncbi:YeiH family protein [Paraglaciecola aestuariivivens]